MSAHPTQSPRSRGEVWNADHAVEYVLKQSHAAEPALLVEEVSDHCCFIIDYPLIARRIVCSRAQPGLPSTLPLEAAILSGIRSPVHSVLEVHERQQHIRRQVLGEDGGFPTHAKALRRVLTGRRSWAGSLCFQEQRVPYSLPCGSQQCVLRTAVTLTSRPGAFRGRP